ncbi:uncharacterized protein LOC111462917 isoform X2 [Cucurbita moschata]|nr:uncharacterized protein LOC111462917 isoform X2 [Cucurbita moschata]
MSRLSIDSSYEFRTHSSRIQFHLAMEGWGRRISSQPSNYFSNPPQKEKEEQQQKVQRTEPAEKDDQKPAVQKPRIKATSRSRSGSRKFQTYYRAEPASNPRNVKETYKKTEDGGEPLLEKDEKEKKSRRKGRKKNVRAPKEEMQRTSPTPEENLKEEMRERECKAGGRKNVWVRKMDEKEGTKGQCRPEIGYTHEMKEMENKLSGISVSSEIERAKTNGVYRGCSQGNRNLQRWAPRKQRNVGMIWERKDELSNG